MTHLPTVKTFDLLMAYFVDERKLIATLRIRKRSRTRRARHPINIQVVPRELDQSPSAIAARAHVLEVFIDDLVVPALLERLLKSQPRTDASSASAHRVEFEPSTVAVLNPSGRKQPGGAGPERNHNAFVLMPTCTSVHDHRAAVFRQGVLQSWSLGGEIAPSFGRFPCSGSLL